MTECSDSEHYVLYRVVVQFDDDWDWENASDRTDIVGHNGGFMASWFQCENVWETLLKQRVPDLEEKTLERVEKRVGEAFSSNRVVDGFIERYRFDRIVDLKDRSSIKIPKRGGSRCQECWRRRRLF